jgi:hypothetical protein
LVTNIIKCAYLSKRLASKIVLTPTDRKRIKCEKSIPKILFSTLLVVADLQL